MTLPPAVAAVRFAVRRGLADVEPGRTVLVACSGGADSLALLAAAVVEGRRAGLRVVGVTVDHGLQEGSAARAEAVVRQMAGLGVDETVSTRVRVEGGGRGPEAAAREARYAVLEQVADHVGASVVLLGHTRDDQAETVLLGLTRGSGGRSLAGMRRAFERYRRPLLDVSRSETAAACTVEGIEVWSDPHNDDPSFTRVRVRHRVLPLLEAELGPGVAATLARTADQLRSDMEYLDEAADRALDRVTTGPGSEPGPTFGLTPGPTSSLASGPTSGLDVHLLEAEPAPLRRRVLHAAALRAGALASDLAHEHVLAMEELVTAWRGQRWIDLPGHVRAVRREGLITFERG